MLLVLLVAEVSPMSVNTPSRLELSPRINHTDMSQKRCNEPLAMQEQQIKAVKTESELIAEPTWSFHN